MRRKNKSKFKVIVIVLMPTWKEQDGIPNDVKCIGKFVILGLNNSLKFQKIKHSKT